jgi:hypothetical protein
MTECGEHCRVSGIVGNAHSAAETKVAGSLDPERTKWLHI